MIGVIANSADLDVVREFFELFKTPWEPHRPHGRYSAVLCAGDAPGDVAGDVVIVYGGGKTRFDEAQDVATGGRVEGFCMLAEKGSEIPIYGGVTTFPATEAPLLTLEKSGACAAFVKRTGGRTCVRIGYDLFSEIRTLLTAGQPPAQAHLPAVELQIDFLRRVLIGCGIVLVEIPPVPEGYGFIACLTHDVDHPFVRGHILDHTGLGFLFRTVALWFWDLVCGRISFRNVITNWNATLKLPFVHLGLAKDFWSDFDEQYAAVEKGLPSTYFVIPFRGRPGKGREGSAPIRRSSGYGAKDIAGPIARVMKAGNEVCLHGIDAWCDGAKAREEMDEIRKVSGASRMGVRMHWLYQNEQTPQVLEDAGADFDSTAGYGVTVGYRAGTGQAYRPFGANRLLELPLHIMDTALFYLSYLGLTHRGAMQRLAPMLENAARFGGCLTVNWHDRSLAPERLWGETYGAVLGEMKKRGPWFATAGEAVAWFRMRRSARFVNSGKDGEATQVQCAADAGAELPGLMVRIHKRGTRTNAASAAAGEHLDVPAGEFADAPVSPAA